MPNTICGNDTICSNDLLVGYTPLSVITLDLSTLGLPEGTHVIQFKLSDDGATKRDSALSNGVSYVVSSWEYPVEDGDNLIITQANTIIDDGDKLIIE